MLKEVLLIWKLKQTEKKSLESREFWDIESFERIYKFERMERIRDESLPTKVGLEGRKCMLFRHLRNFCKKKKKICQKKNREHTHLFPHTNHKTPIGRVLLPRHVSGMGTAHACTGLSDMERCCLHLLLYSFNLSAKNIPSYIQILLIY